MVSFLKGIKWLLLLQALICLVKSDEQILFQRRFDGEQKYTFTLPKECVCETNSSLTSNAKGTFSAKLYVDSGADLIVGSHAHVLEGMEYYKDKLIAYNLGDFLFSHVSDYTGILTLNLSNDGAMSYKFIPAYQENFYTSLLSGNEATKLYDLMTKWSVNVEIDNDGNVKKYK